ncbi:MAG TPA: hypothetical protein VJU87_02120 [Gemmatimonadaceae bacterium]|nr:hypothetical protein [Gemmatimonadaceae bacterium]
MLRVSIAGALALCAAAGIAAGAQNNTNVPIVNVPAPFFTPNAGSVPVPVNVAVAGAILSATQAVEQEAGAGNLTSPITGVGIPPAVAQVVIAMMTDARPEVRRQIRSALAQSGASSTVINQLMNNLPSLLTNPTAGQLQTVLSAFNGLVNNANAAFLANPPAEFLGIHAVLLQISNAANAVPGR